MGGVRRKGTIFAADSNGQNGLWIRAFDSETARLLFGTKGARFPFWSPDGADRSVAPEGVQGL